MLNEKCSEYYSVYENYYCISALWLYVKVTIIARKSGFTWTTVVLPKLLLFLTLPKACSELQYNIFHIGVVTAITASVCFWPEWSKFNVRAQVLFLGLLHVVQHMPSSHQAQFFPNVDRFYGKLCMLVTLKFWSFLSGIMFCWL